MAKLASRIDFVIENLPFIIIFIGLIGWFLCGFYNIEVFCGNWQDVFWGGVLLLILFWMINKSNNRK